MFKIHLIIATLVIQIVESNLFYKNDLNAGDNPYSIHILMAQPKLFRIELKHALESRETVSSMVERTEAVAGINAGFFRRGGELNGNSIGLLKIDGQLFSDPGLERGTLGWNNSLDPQIASLRINWFVITNQQTFPVNKINQPCLANEAVLYTRQFGKYTLNKKGTKEFIIINNKIKKINNQGHSKIHKDGFVYTIGTTSSINQTGLLNLLKEEDAVYLSKNITTDSPDIPYWQTVKYLVNGAGTLIKNGQIKTDAEIIDELGKGNSIASLPDEISANFKNPKEADWLVNKKHPRTAIGFKEDGTWVFIVVEGRQKEYEGFTLPELALYMKQLGCINALNLGGGGDSTMVIDNKIVNQPSGSSSKTYNLGERPVSDSILIFAK